MVLEVIHPDDREMVRTAIDAALDRSKPYDIVFRIVPKRPGNKIRSIVAPTSYETSKEIRIVWSGTALDVTEERIALEAAENSRKMFVSIFETCPGSDRYK